MGGGSGADAMAAGRNRHAIVFRLSECFQRLHGCYSARMPCVIVRAHKCSCAAVQQAYSLVERRKLRARQAAELAQQLQHDQGDAQPPQQRQQHWPGALAPPRRGGGHWWPE
jgi:hypothetical protein